MKRAHGAAQVRPRKLAVGKVAAVDLVPHKPLGGRWQAVVVAAPAARARRRRRAGEGAGGSSKDSMSMV